MHGNLQQLANHLKTIEPNAFDIKVYCFGGNLIGGTLPFHRICGTTACALGHATDVWPDTFALTRAASTGNEASLIHLKTGRCVSWMEPPVLDFFNITYSDSDYLFGPHSDRSVEEEVEAIETFIRERSND